MRIAYEFSKISIWVLMSLSRCVNDVKCSRRFSKVLIDGASFTLRWYDVIDVTLAIVCMLNTM